MHINPASKEIFIPNAEGQVTFTDQWGRQFQLAKSNYSSYLLETLNPGVYTVTFTIGDKTSTQRVVVF